MKILKMVRHLRAPSIRNVNSVSVAFQGTESEQESTGGSGDPMHSFVSHYENVGSTFRQQSWKKQKQKAIAVPTPRAGNVGSNSNTLGRGRPEGREPRVEAAAVAAAADITNTTNSSSSNSTITTATRLAPPV